MDHKIKGNLKKLFNLFFLKIKWHVSISQSTLVKISFASKFKSFFLFVAIYILLQRPFFFFTIFFFKKPKNCFEISATSILFSQNSFSKNYEESTMVSRPIVRCAPSIPSAADIPGLILTGNCTYVP